MREGRKANDSGMREGRKARVRVWRRWMDGRVMRREGVRGEE